VRYKLRRRRPPADAETKSTTTLMPISEATLNDLKAVDDYARGRATEFAKKDFLHSHPGYEIAGVAYSWGRHHRFFSRSTPHVCVIVTGRRP